MSTKSKQQIKRSKIPEGYASVDANGRTFALPRRTTEVYILHRLGIYPPFNFLCWVDKTNPNTVIIEGPCEETDANTNGEMLPQYFMRIKDKAVIEHLAWRRNYRCQSNIETFASGVFRATINNLNKIETISKQESIKTTITQIDPKEIAELTSVKNVRWDYSGYKNFPFQVAVFRNIGSIDEQRNVKNQVFDMISGVCTDGEWKYITGKVIFFELYEGKLIP
jgi:hypothetical protein